jgi:hypothetical protein
MQPLVLFLLRIRTGTPHRSRREEANLTRFGAMLLSCSRQSILRSDELETVVEPCTEQHALHVYTIDLKQRAMLEDRFLNVQHFLIRDHNSEGPYSPFRHWATRFGLFVHAQRRVSFHTRKDVLIDG